MSPHMRWLIIPWLVAVPFALAQDPKGAKDSKPMPDPKPMKDPKLEPVPNWNDESRDETYLRKITDRMFVHDEARVSFAVPAGWKEIKPQRLARKIDPRINAVLRIEEPQKDVVASLYWMPMNPGQKLSDWVRDTPSGGEYGEEYETLKAIYGAPPKVSLPTRSKVGPFEVYRIGIAGGPDRGDRYDGMLYVFEVKSGPTTWLLKARISFPKKEPKGEFIQYEPYALEVLRGYGLVPDRAPGGDK